MANICNNYIHISGDEGQLEALSTRLRDQDPKLIKTVPNFMVQPTSDYCIYSLNDIRFEKEVVSFCFGSKHKCPLNAIADLSTEYPDLEFNVHYEEVDCEYYGDALIVNGGYGENEMEEEEYLSKYNDEYIGTKALLESCSYEEFLRDYTHDNFFDEHPFGYLDKIVVERIEDKDLPLFINRQWNDMDAEEEYKLRLSGGSKVEPKKM
jgi:hypothetical protein